MESEKERERWATQDSKKQELDFVATAKTLENAQGPIIREECCHGCKPLLSPRFLVELAAPTNASMSGV